MPITIDLVHDVVCPWCRIGKKNLDDALAGWDGEEIVLSLHPFFLQPGMPSAGRDFRDHMRSLKGDDNIDAMLINVSNAGLRAGLNFKWDLIQRMPNTLLAHALVLSAPIETQGALLDAVHLAYFEQGIDIGRQERLIEIGQRFDLDTSKLDDQEFLDDVAGAAEAARAQGIQGVPFFIINQQLAVSGAQPPSVLLGAIEQAASSS
ncbi:MAG TPA: DsbA family oxidoreductase [Thermomicrobiales bacterium]|nr:DsbA family oxidoreductase [Thermomicrobiales bacterium]